MGSKTMWVVVADQLSVKLSHPSEAVVFNDLAIATWLDRGLFLGTDGVTEAAWTTFVQLLSQK